MWALPILCWFLGVLLFVRRGFEWRAAFLTSAVLWGCLVTISTESLSSFDLLTTGGLALCWTVATVAALALNFRLKQPWRISAKLTFSPVEPGLVFGVALICLATFVTAILAPPNTWDSMTYHMSRVMHWLQNRSVAHYPTHIVRQLEMNPWAEFAIAHFQALSGGDRYANLVQWFSMVGSLVGVSLVAQQLGGDRRAQLFAVIVASTIPMGILQASSTQNDYVVAFWLICLASAGLQFIKHKELKWALLAGASLGLAVLSKGTAYLYAFPFAIWIVFAMLRCTPRQLALAALCIVVPFLLLNVNHYHRNFTVFSNPLHSGDTSLFNEDISAKSLVSNLLRHTALQLSSPSRDLNQTVESAVSWVHNFLHIDKSDPRTSFHGYEFRMGKLRMHEDLSGNFLHVLLAGAVLLTLVVSRSLRKTDKFLLCYVSSVLAALLLFCLLLKWQPWSSRLLLPLLLIGAPMIGVIATRYWKPVVVTAISLVLLIAAMPWTFSNETRPLVHFSKGEGIMFPLLTVDRNLLYFVNRLDLYDKYVQIAGDVQRKNAASIGLILTGDGWEYPLWVLINQGDHRPVRFEHIEIENASRLARSTDFRPDYYVRID
jgi:hypothetical protein